MRILFNSQMPDTAWLSNMYPSDIIVEGRAYRCTEAYYQAAKSGQWERFMQLNGFAAKKLGRQLPIQDGWNDQRLMWMRKALRAKFREDNALGQALMDTHSQELVEFAPWDWKGSFWGINRENVGENNMGILLMQRREFLQSD